MQSAAASDNCGVPTVTYVDKVTPGGSCPQENVVDRTFTATVRGQRGLQQLRASGVCKLLRGWPPPATTLPTARGPLLLKIREQCEVGHFPSQDACGNQASCTQQFIITDNTAPTWASGLPPDVTVQCDQVPQAVSAA